MKINKISYIYRAITISLAVMTLFLFSCERRIPLKKPPPIKKPVEKEAEEREVEDHFSRAEKYWAKGQFDKALASYESYLKKFPAGDRANDALAKKAEIFYKKGKYEDALPIFLQIVNEYPLNEKRADIHLFITKTYFRLNDYSESRLSALRWLELYKNYPGKEPDIYSVLGHSLKELNNYPRAFFWLVKALDPPYTGMEERKGIEEEISGLISEVKEEEDLKKMLEYARGSRFIKPVYYRLALFLVSSGRLEEARDAALKIVSLSPEGEWALKAKELIRGIQRRLEVSPSVIGCLLPLTGPFKIYGEGVLKGIELGMGLFQQDPGQSPLLELEIRDTRGDPETAIKAVTELAKEEKAIALVGPLISKVSEEATERAQELGLPIITLSQSEHITGKGKMVFQNCLTPEDQLRSLIKKVMGEMGMTRFAILYPENAYGKFFMEKFWDKVEARGGEITAVESYNPEATDFAEEIKKIAGLYSLEKQSGGGDNQKEESGEDLKPIIDFDAIFIPDGYKRASLIASQLAFYDVVGIHLLGTNLWNSPKLIEIAGDHVEGAIFPSGFFPGSGYRDVDYFVDQYRANFGHDPGLLAAIGYDTIKIIRRQLAPVIRTRDDFQSALSKMDEFHGVTGPLYFDTSRQIKREPLLLTVRGGHFLPVP